MPGKLSVDLLELYRAKGYENHFAEMVFFVAAWTEDPQEPATVSFRLSLTGGEVIVPTLPVVRTAKRAETEGVPLYAVVLDREAKRLGRDAVDVTASLGQSSIKLAENGQGIWQAVARGVPLGDHWAELRATWKADPQKSVVTRLSVRVTDGQFVSYDPKLRLLMRAGTAPGPDHGLVPRAGRVQGHRHRGRVPAARPGPMGGRDPACPAGPRRFDKRSPSPTTASTSGNR